MNGLRHGEPFFLRLHANQLTAHKFLDGRDEKGISFVGETDRGASGSGPTRAPDPVYVILRIMRQLKIDDMIHPLDVNSASGYIRCHQYPYLSGFKNAVAGQHLRESSHFVASVAENQGAAQVLPDYDVKEQGKFLIRGHDVDNLFNCIDRDLFWFDFNGYRVAGPL